MRSKIIGFLLILVGLAFYAYPSIREVNMENQTNEIIKSFDEKYSSYTLPESKVQSEVTTDDSTLANQETESFPAKEDVEDTVDVEANELYNKMQQYNENLTKNGQNLVDAWSYEQIPAEFTEIGNEAIGYIEIPDMELTMPLYIGASTSNMSKGAAILSETSMPIGGTDTNCVIAGHRGYQGLAYFREIEKLTIGSEIYLTNPWETLTYVAAKIEVIDPDDVGSILIEPGKDMITLLTCHPYMGSGKYRYVVYCERKDESVSITETTAEDTIYEAAVETGDDDIIETVITAIPIAESVAESNGEHRENTSTIKTDSWLIGLEKILRCAFPITIIICAVACTRRNKSQ